MKKLIYLSLVLPFFLFSCESRPEASFFTDTQEPVLGQEVVFKNTSQNARDFEWDFGDGYISDETDPTHIYQLTGTYDVVLTAVSKKGLESKARLTISVVEPSLIVIEVLEYYDVYPVANASVILYPTINDWINTQNPIIEGTTGSDGVVVFADLDPIVHYVDVWEQNHDNYQLAAEDEGFITTPKIIPHTVQWFVAYVDYVVHTKGMTKGERTMVIKKLERKASDRKLSISGSGTENWQELFARRVNKK